MGFATSHSLLNYLMFTLRPYQQAAVDAVYNHLRAKNNNPCIVLPTAAGKSAIMATICRDAVTRWNGRVLILAHVKELLQQAADKLQMICPDVKVGVYSAGLGSRETNAPIIIAGIQSVYKRACELDRFDLILVDEAHLLPPDGEGMYQTFLQDAKIVNPKVRLIGLTATPYRMKSGTLIGPDCLLNEICYQISIPELIEQGYLCPLKSKSGRHKVDCSDLHVRGGEFVASEVDELMNTTDNVDAACREIIAQAKDRHSVLIFGASVAHATRIKETIERLTNTECGLVTGDTPAAERDRILRRFKGESFAKDLLGGATEPLKYLANVNVLTTGFDAPNIDCVVLLRPTASPGLYAQMTGRAFRLHESKKDALILDYGGNILRHGPVDAIQIKEKNGKGSGNAPVKECPQCQLMVHAAMSTCPDCGYAFPPPERGTHEERASTEGILTGEVTDVEYDVQEMYYSVHTKRGAAENDPRTIRVDYQVGLNEIISEWICPEHSGWARKKFEGWWKERSHDPVPDSADFAVRIAKAGGLAETNSIVVRKVSGERFNRIIKYSIGDKPHSVSENLDPDDVDGAGFLSDDVPF
jgi:DNA repair protein RadD